MKVLPHIFLRNCFCILFLMIISSRVSSQSLRFADTSYVNLGNHASLKLTDFTLEAWVKIEGYGSTTETGSGGISGVVPIITKGRAESENAAVDINYFLGYNLSTMRMVADFEDDASSANHPVTSTGAGGVLPMCTWTHVAVSYNTNTDTWKMYVNGVLNTTLALGSNFTPRSASDVPVGIGTSLNGGTIRPGFFNGRIDEVRIWNITRTDADILANYNTELTSGTGLAGRWGLNEVSGSTAPNSVAGGATGALTNAPAWVSGFNQPDPTTNASIDLNGVHDYITFGVADGTVGNPSLNVSPNFSLEAWIFREGTGVTASTGTGGVVAVPILAKGRGESETMNLNMNYFLGVDASNKLVADFEETTGPNHPVISNGTIPMNAWTHVAATFNNTTRTWKLFINGVLDITETEGAGNPPVNNSIQHAAIGTAMNSTGVTEGFFNGKIDEVRIWNVTRADADITSNYNAQLTSGTGLVARYGFNENCGTSAVNSIAGGSTGAIRSNNIATHPTNGGPGWASFGFDNLPPNTPVNSSPANGSTIASNSTNVCATVTHPNGGNMQVSFYGRKKPAAGAKFVVIGLPDTQFYTEEPQGTGGGGGGHNGIFKAQTQWIANRRVDSNIVFVTQLGDCTQNGDLNDIEWRRADTSMKNIENPNVPITHGIPYGICVGNHDQGATGNGVPDGSSAKYNQYFGESRFTGRTYYGGHYGLNNDNHFQLFSGGGVDFIHISIEYYPNGTTPSLQLVLNWADSLLKAHPARKGIVATHNMLSTGNPGNFQGPGQKIYDDLKDNPNLILMLAGHVNGEGRRTDVFNGNTVHTVMSDYQDTYGNGGNGYLRIMQFIPDQNLISVKTYSPTLNNFFTGASSQFTLPVTLTEPFTLIGTNTNVPSGSQTCVNWTSLQLGSEYEWYAVVTDGTGNIATGPTWSFIVPPPAAPVVTTHPSSQTICSGNTVIFTSSATGMLPPTVQWQISTDNGGNWNNIPAATSSTYSFTVTNADNGRQYRAVWTNASGTVNSVAAILTVPQINISAVVIPVVCPGNNTASIDLSASTGGAPLMFSIDGGSNYFASGIFNSLSAGSYNVRIKDANNCTKDTSISVAPVVAHWLGVTDNNWHVATNWSTGKVPDIYTHVVIDGGTPNICLISTANGNAASIRSKPGSLFNISPVRTIFVAANCGTLPPE